jgi:DNA uptake protein ComE-like DNA-binding protein
MRGFIAGLTLGIVIALVINARGRRRTKAERMPESLPEQPALASRATADVLNTATEEQLLSVYGIGPALAQKIILGRPYSSARELLERKIISRTIFENLRRELLEAS